MKSIRFTLAVVALMSALTGCAVDTPSAGGNTVRAIMASQIVPAQPHGPARTDAAAAVAAYGNYQRSYTTPESQGDRSSFGLSGKK